MCFARLELSTYAYLTVLLLFAACTSSELDSHLVDPASGSVSDLIPNPIGTGDVTRDCLKSCTEACGDYGAWSAPLPETDTVCEGKELTQSQSRTRTCVATCPEVQCLKTETKEIEAEGTKNCPKPSPPCQTSCTTGCEEKVFGNWSPAVDSQCKDDNLHRHVDGHVNVLPPAMTRPIVSVRALSAIEKTVRIKMLWVAK